MNYNVRVRAGAVGGKQLPMLSAKVSFLVLPLRTQKIKSEQAVAMLGNAEPSECLEVGKSRPKELKTDRIQHISITVQAVLLVKYLSGHAGNPAL